MVKSQEAETELACEKCGAEVWLIDGDYQCDCSAIPFYMIDSGIVDYYKFWHRVAEKPDNE